MIVIWLTAQPCSFCGTLIHSLGSTHKLSNTCVSPYHKYVNLVLVVYVDLASQLTSETVDRIHQC